MPAPGTVLEPSVTEVNFIKTALSSSIRIDGRSFNEARRLNIRFDEQLGWVEVCLGDTRVVVSTSGSLIAPRTDRPYEGFVEIRAEVQPMAGTQFERGRAKDEEVKFERAIDRAIRRSDVVDREALCVVAGFKVWCITLHVHLLSAQGAAVDAAVLACITALRHFRRPDATVESNTNVVQGKGKDRPHVVLHDVLERVPIPLALHHHPLSVSFAIFDPAHMHQSYVSGVGAGTSSATAEDEDDSNVIILIDPLPLEALLCTSTMLVVANVQGEICVLDKAGGRPLSEAVVNRVLGLASLRVKELNRAMDDALRHDAKERVVEVN